MAGKTKTRSANHLRAWRERAELTQLQLAERAGTKSSVISELESGTMGLSDKWLHRLAPLLGTTAGHLLDHHPDDVDSDVLELFKTIPKEDRSHALEILRTFSRKAR